MIAIGSREFCEKYKGEQSTKTHRQKVDEPEYATIDGVMYRLIKVEDAPQLSQRQKRYRLIKGIGM